MRTTVVKLHGKEIHYKSDSANSTFVRQYKGRRIAIIVDDRMNINSFNTVKQLIRNDLMDVMGTCVGVKYTTFANDWEK